MANDTMSSLPLCSSSLLLFLLSFLCPLSLSSGALTYPVMEDNTVGGGPVGASANETFAFTTNVTVPVQAYNFHKVQSLFSF